MRRTVLLLLLLTCCYFLVHAQDKTASVQGRIMHKVTQEPVPDIQVQIPDTRSTIQTDAAGIFLLEHIPYGTYTLVIGSDYARKDTLQLVVDREQVDLGNILFRPGTSEVSMQQLQIPTIALEDNDRVSDADGMQGQAVSSLLVASRDPFLNTVAFVFGPYRFQPRGYSRNMQQVFINDVPVNDLETGDALWNQWGGLNDVFRARSQTYGLSPSSDAFGGINGAVSFDASAIDQQRQTRVTYSLSNRQYRNRLMLTHSSGIMKGGWAYTLSASRRWGNEGYIAGTFYDGYSYYAGVSKLYKKHQFSLTSFGAPTRRGKSAPATREAYELAGSHFYNPNWGYQNGEKRNARVASSFQPVFILNHQYTPNEKLGIYTAVSYQQGKSGNSSLDWFNARSPLPDYYRNMPSWYLASNNNNPEAAESIREQWETEPEKYAQIDWDHLYQMNYANVETIHNVDGIEGNDVQGKRSVYVVGDDVDDIRKFSFNTRIEKKFGERVLVHGGLTFITQQTESYRELLDLLGGDFYLNLNSFAIQSDLPEASFAQYDLNNPNRLIRVGDKYNYDYISRFHRGWAWLQGQYITRKFDFFLAARGGMDAFSREGKFMNGLFPDISYGKSAVQQFTTYAVKGGATWKVNGRNYFFLNGGIATDAPTLENTFMAIRTRNTALNGAKVQTSKTLEGGYLLKSPGYNARVAGYVTDVTDAVDTKRFFIDNPVFQSLGSYVMQGLDMRFIGTELALEAKVSSSVSLTGVVALGQAFYTSNPRVSIFLDNDTLQVAQSPEVYIRNHYVAAGPQSAYSLGVNYRSPKYWYANLRFNCFARNYVAINPDRRTPEVSDRVLEDTALYYQIFSQEKLPAAITADLFFGKSFLLSKISRKMPRNTFLYVNAGINNLLNNKNIRTGGFEQLRYDFEGNNPMKFPPKYFYGYGANYFVSVSLKF